MGECCSHLHLYRDFSYGVAECCECPRPFTLVREQGNAATAAICKWLFFLRSLSTFQQLLFLWVLGQVGPCVSPLRGESPFPIALGCQPHWFSKPEILGTYFSGVDPRGWGVNPLLPWEKYLSGEIPPYCVLPHWGWEFWQKHFSTSLTYIDVVLFILCSGVGVQLTLRLFSEGIDPYVAIYLLYPWEEVNLGSSSSTILNYQSPVWSFFIAKCKSKKRQKFYGWREM